MSSEVGYTGGEIKNPDYRKACSFIAVLSCPVLLLFSSNLYRNLGKSSLFNM